MKTEIKKTWTQIVAVAAAAVCAVTATCAGATINHADAADGNIAYLYAVDDNWAINTSNNSFDNSVVVTGDGSYSLTITNENSYAASSWTPTTTDWGGTIGVIQLVIEGFTTEEVTIDSLVFPNKTFENVEYARTSGYREIVDDAGSKSYPSAAVLTLDNDVFAGQTVNPGESITVNFTVGEASAVTTTTTASSEEDVTTTTTASSQGGATTTTTVSSSSGAATTTTTKSTTKATTTTTKSTTKATTTTTAPANKETSIDFVQTKVSDGEGDYNACVEFDPKDADYVRFVFKIAEGVDADQATVSYGCWNNATEKWYDYQEQVDVPADRIVSYTAAVPAEIETTMKASVYYPKAKYITIQEVVLIYGDVPATTTASTTEYDSGLTFETITVGESNKLDMLDKCCLVATIKGPSNYSISGGVYHSDVKDEFKNEKTDSATNLLVKVFEVREEADCDFQIHWYANGATTEKTAPVHLVSYYEGDASLNGKVNGSDVRALVNYIAGSTTDEVMEIVCDYDDSGAVKLLDAVTLTKALLSANNS